jgi:hypothetical protein
LPAFVRIAASADGLAHARSRKPHARPPKLN